MIMNDPRLTLALMEGIIGASIPTKKVKKSITPVRIGNLNKKCEVCGHKNKKCTCNKEKV